MKTSILGLLILTVGLSPSSMAQVPPGIPLPVLEIVVPEKAFIPPGFDNNDQAQIVVTGNLRNTCHKIGTPLTRGQPE